MKLNVKGLLTLARLRQLLVYLLLGNIWMTRNQYSGSIPQFYAEDLTGEKVSLRSPESRQKPKILYFFADWCPICKIQHPVISNIGKDFDVYGIAMQSGDTANVKKYVQAQGLDFRVINDESGEISRMLGVNGVPATFIIDKTGQIKYSTRGYATELGLRSRIWLTGKN
jgi:peroxiredoxin